ncbi:IPTL-CTERM sorting domain-containing protein [Acanthopleuribacter pedis]|uniref:IPTL-CTERM sorting domain-containing protein n=1 Tax=Acanthopleuribacter pedis TaxID=442870 RepID=A0A8J7U6J3_9BACT|nr:IPTL-CTERM sorting domain-containing protein [Acanthopleuribacter pedis]MBO1322832.1 IPTL-CTERM sorting domain-containing protein [Acanthopleuribacter pedis]
MKTKIILPLFLAVMALVSTPAFSQPALRIGQITIAPGDITGGGCVQVPVFMSDTIDNRQISQVTVTFDVADADGLIEGGVSGSFMIANAFQATAQAGLTNPGTDLNNLGTGSTGAVTCSGGIFNQATQGGAAVDFVGGSGGPQVFTFPDGGNPQRHSASYASLVGTLIEPTAGTEYLIAVLEIPISTGTASRNGQVTITPVPEGGGNPTNNFVTLDDGLTRIGFTVGDPGTISIFEAPTCVAGNVTVDDPNSDVNNGGVVGVDWLDPQVGGTGGVLDFTFANTTDIDRIVLSGGGLATAINIDNGGNAASLNQSINTAGNGSPSAASNNTYTVTYQVEFPPGSGTFLPAAGGSDCTIETAWNPPTATITPNPTPISGGSTDFSVVLRNVVYDSGNSRFSVFTSNATGFGGDETLNAPTSTAGTELTYTNVYNIASVDADDIGTYSAAVTGPNSQTATGTYSLALEPPQNNTDCANIPQATIGSNLTIPVAGANVTEWSVIYNGTTVTAPGSATEVTIGPIVGTATSVEIRANGFTNDDPPVATFVAETCTLDFVAPTCGAQAQDPVAGTQVDVGTVFTLTLTTTNAVSVTINGVNMTEVSTAGADTNWTASYTATTNEMVNAVITGADGDEVTCTAAFDIQVNCINPTILGVTGTLGGTGTVSVSGTGGCSYDVTVTAPALATPQVVAVAIPDCGDPVCVGTATIQYPLDATISVANGNTIFTVPTLGEWGLIAFITLLMGSAVVMMRRRREV